MKSARDTGFTTFAGTLGVVVAARFGLSDPEQVLVVMVTGFALAAGWRALRKFAPWVTEDDNASGD